MLGGRELRGDVTVFIILQQLFVIKAETILDSDRLTIKRAARGGNPLKKQFNYFKMTPINRGKNVFWLQATASLHGLLQADLHEEVCWGEDPKTDGKKDPALHAAPPVLIVHQLLTDLAVNLIPAHEEKHERVHRVVKMLMKEK